MKHDRREKRDTVVQTGASADGSSSSWRNNRRV